MAGAGVNKVAPDIYTYCIAAAVATWARLVCFGLEHMEYFDPV
jgi:hypothetical protein